MSLESIQKLMQADMRALDQLIVDHVQSDISLIKQLGQHIVHSGGKRLRPLLVLLAARAFAYQGQQHHGLAAAIEFIHTATLLHDDVVDDAKLRRGRETANTIWGNEASVLVGDFLYSRAFQLTVAIDNIRVLRILADATNTIAQGEVLQLMNVQNPEITEQDYMQVIRCKTAKLFEAAAQLGALISGCNEEQITAMAEYGILLGIAFQIVDDALDYTTNSKTFGKDCGNDLSTGKLTLPLIFSYKNATPEQQQLIKQAIKTGDAKQFDAINQIIQSTNAIEHVYKTAQQQIDKAIQVIANIPESPYRQALIDLARFAIKRNY